MDHRKHVGSTSGSSDRTHTSAAKTNLLVKISITKLTLDTETMAIIFKSKDIEIQEKENQPVRHRYNDDIDGAYGWVIVFCSFLFLFYTSGVNSAFGIYFAEYIRNNTFEGATNI